MTDAKTLLAELQRQGVSVIPYRDRLRVKPISRVRREVREVLQRDRALIIRELQVQTQRILWETQHKVQELARDSAWCAAWQTRFAKHGSKWTVTEVLHAVQICLEVAQAHSEAGDVPATRSACNFALATAMGRSWA